MFLNTRVLCYLWWYESSFSRWVTNSRLSQLSQPNSTSSIWSSWPWCRNSNWSRSSCNSKPTAPPLQTAHTSVSHRHSRLSHRSWFPLSSVTLTVFSSPATGPGEYVGPGQRSDRRLGPRHRRPTAGSQTQGGAGPGRRSQRRPLPLRYDNCPAETQVSNFEKALT